jgi:hypothetical protein
LARFRCAERPGRGAKERPTTLSLSPQIATPRRERDRLDLGVDAHPFREAKRLPSVSRATAHARRSRPRQARRRQRSHSSSVFSNYHAVTATPADLTSILVGGGLLTNPFPPALIGGPGALPELGSFIDPFDLLDGTGVPSARVTGYTEAMRSARRVGGRHASIRKWPRASCLTRAYRHE